MSGRPIGRRGLLLMLAFDHRSSFAREVTGTDEAVGPDAARVRAAKEVVFEGLARAAAEVDAAALGLLVDEQYGAAVVSRARALGITVAVPVERSGQAVFEFEYGEDFMDHVRGVGPDMAKVLVRLNVEDDPGANEIQLERLRRLADELRPAGYGFLFELLVPPTERQLESCGHERDRYERELRPRLIVAGMRAVQAAGIEPDVWKVEGVERVDEAAEIIAAARAEARWADVACTVLGAGAAAERVGRWLDTAAAAGFSGFAIGRSIWRDPLRAHLEGDLTETEVSAVVHERFLQFAVRFQEKAAAAGS